ncbi:MAG TPA: class I SAM-dependent methyltransferase [Burkholderiales bacterium]|nr:class I SAM-dependent methyltransferase [Burkholderiales bacterium]
MTVIDLCETPLALNRWYAERAQIRIDTRVGDAGTGLGVEDQDLICTHALIGNFAPAERVHLFTAWHRALRRGGTVVTVNRLRPPGRSRDASGEKVAAFLALVRSRAIAHELGIEAGALADAAAPYYDAARQCARWPVHSAGELCAQLDQAGFEIVECTIVDTGAEARATALDLPTVPGNARYVQLTAARR